MVVSVCELVSIISKLKVAFLTDESCVLLGGGKIVLLLLIGLYAVQR